MIDRVEEILKKHCVKMDDKYNREFNEDMKRVYKHMEEVRRDYIKKEAESLEEASKFIINC